MDDATPHPARAMPADAAAHGAGRGEARRFLPRWRWHNVVRLLGRARGTFALSHRPTAAQAHRLHRAERRGLQLAILCRTLVFGVAFVWYVGSLFVSGSAPTLLGIAALLVLTGLGVAHFIVIGTRFDRPWVKYAATLLDVAGVCTLFAVTPVSSGEDVPQIFAFRGVSAIVLIPFIALSTLALSPRLTAVTGLASALFWLVSWRIVSLGVPDPLSWSDMPPRASRAEYEAVFLSANFIGSGTRYTEAIILTLVAAVLALAVARARRVFFAQIAAEAQRAAERERRTAITQRLGRFVPAAIAERLIEDPSVLEPRVREGAALVMDVEGFTTFAEGRDPGEVIAELNRFLARCATAVSEVEGVVIAFTGDGLLATFNTPLETAQPERAALAAARALVACGGKHGFRLRVGVAAGPIAAGSVGSEERQAFTVYGNTVNRAARLESLAKTLGETILVDERCARANGTGAAIEGRGDHRVEGLSERIAVYAAAPQERDGPR